MSPQHDHPNWQAIVGDNWPSIEPGSWNGLGSAARAGASGVDVAGYAQARRGFDERVRVSDGLSPARDAMAAEQVRLNRFEGALNVAADVFDQMADLVRRTRNRILDIADDAEARIRAVQGRSDDGSSPKEKTADIVAIINAAKDEVDQVISDARHAVGPSGFPSLADIADLTGRPNPGGNGTQPIPFHPSAGHNSSGGRRSGPPLRQTGLLGAGFDPNSIVSQREWASPHGTVDAMGALGHGRDGSPRLNVSETAGDAGSVPAPSGGPGIVTSGSDGHGWQTEWPRADSAAPWYPGGAAEGVTSPSSDLLQPDPGTVGGGPMPDSPGSAAESNPGDAGYPSGVDPHTSTLDTASPSGGGGSARWDPDTGGDGTPTPIVPSDAQSFPGPSPIGPVLPSIGAADIRPAPVRPGREDTQEPDSPSMRSIRQFGPAEPPTDTTSARVSNPVPRVAAPGGAGRPANSPVGPTASTAATSAHGAEHHSRRGHGRPDRRAESDPRVVVGTGPGGSDASADSIVSAVGAAMAMAAGPGFTAGRTVDGELVLARTLLRSILAVVDDSPLGPAWSVAVLRHARGLSAFVTSNEGRGWVPSGLYLPREVATPWVWEVARESTWEGLADPARVLVEFALAWGAGSDASLAALVSSRPIDSSIRRAFPDLPMAEAVTAARELDFSTPAPGRRDRLEMTAAPRLLERVAAVREEAIARTRLDLAQDAHRRVTTTPAAGSVDEFGAVAARVRLLHTLLRRRPVPTEWWDELSDTSDLLAAMMLPLQLNTSSIPVGELRIDRLSAELGRLRALTFERRCNELVLLLATEPDRVSLRDAVYVHGQIADHPALAEVGIPIRTVARH
ncbi:hypothetical protein [Nocardia sp. NBC_00511]|uniref:hypothetical protein n=1 Tax=Nocardia sp. NBC_00511 TaxID=2903591 RepID=UPI002F91A074